MAAKSQGDDLEANHQIEKRSRLEAGQQRWNNEKTAAPLVYYGDPRLLAVCEPVSEVDQQTRDQAESLIATLVDIRRRFGYGRGLAGPQIGVLRRMVALHLGASPFVLVNPEITWRSSEKFRVWDDCFSIPDRIVRVERHRSISVRYRDLEMRERHWEHLPADLAELLQHEIDHLDGILMTARATGEDAIQPISEHARLVGAARPQHRLSLAHIAQSAATIDPVFLHSPQYLNEPLSARLGCRLMLKVETTNPIRSFKGRGTSFFVRQIVEQGRVRPLVCASSGNFGQGMAFACRAAGLPLTVFASTNASPLKLERMRALGAEVVLAGEDFDAAKLAARQFAIEHDRWMVEDGREPEISEGAGSIGVELLARGDAFDAALIPLGNGALLSGVGRWLKAASPATKLIGVCASAAPAMYASWKSKQIVNAESTTMADGIGIRIPVPEALADLEGLVDDIWLVTEENLRESCRLLFHHAGLIVEPSGAAAVAALIEHNIFQGASVAAVICGGNATLDQLRGWQVI